MRHLDNMAKVMLATGMVVAYGYVIEAFMSFYSGNTFEKYMTLNRWTGPYAFFYWCLIACNIAIPQMLWSKKGAFECGAAFCAGAGDQCGHVARAFRDRSHQLAPGFHAVRVGPLYSHEVGLGGVRRHHRFLLNALFPVHPFPAGDFDFRIADAGALRGGQAGVLARA